MYSQACSEVAAGGNHPGATGDEVDRLPVDADERLAVRATSGEFWSGR